MTLVRFNSQPSYSGLLDHLFMNTNRSNGTCEPSVNIYNGESSFVIEMAVPGYAKEEFNISLEQQTLKITAEARQTEVDENKFLRRDFSFNGVNRSFVLPKNIDTESINADFRDGILRITLPRKQETIVKKEISIS